MRRYSAESENTYDGMKAANRFMGPTLYDTVVRQAAGAAAAAVGGASGWAQGRHIYVTAVGPLGLTRRRRTPGHAATACRPPLSTIHFSETNEISSVVLSL